MTEGTRATGRSRRTAVAAVACLSGVLLLGIAAAPAGAAGDVTVSQTSLPDGGSCVPTLFGRSALTYRRESTVDHFRLTVVNRWHLCDPIDATAVVYGMPGGGRAWPQHLLESETFEIGGPSTTVITFAKGCRPAQFDVVTGDTPSVVDLLPLGPVHGPLLFPGDLGTAEQYAGTNCGPGATTTTTEVPPVVEGTTIVPPSTSTTSTSTTTTEPGAAATTIPGSGGGGGGGDTPNPDAAVSPAVETRATTPTSPSTGGSSLAFTGAESLAAATLGALLLAAGLLLLAAGRRSRRIPTYWPIALADDEDVLPTAPALFTTHPQG